MIKDGSISGREVCLMLYEQEILKYDEAQYLAVKSGKTSAYDFIRGKIQTLEITPGQLGLEPCTASAVVTDVNTGAVLAWCFHIRDMTTTGLANTMVRLIIASLYLVPPDRFIIMPPRKQQRLVPPSKCCLQLQVLQRVLLMKIQAIPAMDNLRRSFQVRNVGFILALTER